MKSFKSIKKKYTCFDCGESYCQDFSEENDDGHEICNECFDFNYWTCGDCGEIVSNEKEFCPNNCHLED